MLRDLLHRPHILLLALALTGCSSTEPTSSSSDLSSPESVTQYQKQTLAYLASDYLEGRGPGTRGLDLASRFIANEFKSAGLQTLPSAPDYFQPFNYSTGLAPDPAHTSLQLASESLKLNDDFRPNTVTCIDDKTFDGDLVFAGYGIRSSQYNYDDYANLDVKDKIVLVMRFEPLDAQGNSRFTGKDELSSEAGLSRKIRTAQQLGAAAVLFVNPPGKEDTLSPFAPRGARGGVTLPVLQLSRSALDRALASRNLPSLQQLAAPIQATGKPESRPLTGLTAAGETAFDPQSVHVRNVVGLLPGTGPHKDEYIVIGAHYDHLGLGGPGSLAPSLHAVHHGADDNASGTTAVLTLAHQLAAAARQGQLFDRSILFMTFTCEEEGLIGSEYYTAHPLVPLEQTAYMLNLDMVGRLKGNTILHGGEGTADTLQPLLDRCLPASGLTAKSFGKGGFGPSDHASFAQKKIPVLFLFTGLHADYHRPTDTADKINYEGLRQATDLAACLARGLAAAPKAPYNSDADRSKQDIYHPQSTSRRAATQPAPELAERVGLGLIPDMTLRDSPGMRIDGVTPGSAADKAGLKPDDILLNLNNTPINSVEDLQEVYNRHKPGDSATAIIQRGNSKLTLQLTFSRRQSPT